MGREVDRVAVRLTQQQIELLDKLKKEGEMGSEYPEILLNAFRRYAEQFLGRGRFGHVGERS